MKTTSIIEVFEPDRHSDYLRDESKRSGRAEYISFPESEDDIRAALRHAPRQGIDVTTQGARTGITGGAVPDGGHVLNMGRMNRITAVRRDPASGQYTLVAQPGLALKELRNFLHTMEAPGYGLDEESARALASMRRAGRRFFPPDPTESSASIGGMVACNASGACSFRYGPTRRYVLALSVVLPDGDVLRLRRGRDRVAGREFSVRTEEGRSIQGRVPGYRMPDVKNASGYYASDDMDVLDLFIGSEGTLGVISDVELAILPVPECRWGIMAFFASDDPALAYVKGLRALTGPSQPVALEFFDRHCLDLLRRQRANYPSFSEIPEMPLRFGVGVYTEYHGTEAEVGAAVETMSDWISRAGGNPDDTWMASSEAELERLKFFRHAAPESVNQLIAERRKRAPEITKLGTDMAVPDAHLDTVMSLYREGLAATGLEYVMFGHIGNNHLHVNIMPRTAAEYSTGKDLYLRWAQRVVELGGTVSAEHGIGKFKIALLRAMYGDAGIREMRDVKRLFDPEGRLNRGNLF